MNRRGFLKLAGQAGILAALPTSLAVGSGFDWTGYELRFHEPRFNMEWIAWECSGTLTAPDGRKMCVTYLIDEDLAESRHGSVEEYAKKLIREQFSDKEFIKKWLS